MYSGFFDVAPDNGLTADDIFDQSRVRRYNIEISSSDIAKLNADISAEEYVPCTVTTDYGDISATTYKGVGCRYKGAVGSLLKCLEPTTGRPNGDCRKLSIKVDANKYRDDDQKIDGVKRLLFHGMAVDESLVGERLAYNAMNDLGIPAPRAAHGQLYVNGEFDGIYSMIEETGNTITKRYYGDDANNGKGATYKDLWFTAGEVSTAALEESLSAGKEDHAFIQQTYNMIQTASDCATFEQYFDVDSIAKITAFNDYIGQTDDWRYRHNFNFYVNEDLMGSKKLVMLPWDYDRIDDKSGGLPTRRNRVASWMNAKPGGAQCYQQDPPSQVMGYGGFASTYQRRMDANMPPGVAKPIECDKLTRFISTCGYDKVKAYEKQFAAQLPYSTMSARIDQYANEIASSVKQDSSISDSKWRRGREGLKTFLRNAPAQSPTRGRSGASSFGQQFGGQQSFGQQQLGGFGGFGGGLGGMQSFGGLGGLSGMQSMGGFGR